MDATRKPAAESDAPERKPTVLLIDDDHDQLDSLSDALEKHYHVITASDGAIGVERALEAMPELVITDVNMPVKNGFQVCVELKNNERTSHIPLIMLTALTDEVHRNTGMQLGADAYLPKPFKPTDLRSCIQDLLQKKARFRQEIRAAINAPTGTTTDPAAKKETLSDKLRKLVLRYYNEAHFGVDRLADLAELDRKTLERRLGKEENMTPNNLIKEVKLMLSKKLLKEEHDLEIKEIAHKAGFSTPQKFSLDFTDYFGLNPSDYRQKWGRLA